MICQELSSIDAAAYVCRVIPRRKRNEERGGRRIDRSAKTKEKEIPIDLVDFDEMLFNMC